MHEGRLFDALGQPVSVAGDGLVVIFIQVRLPLSTLFGKHHRCVGPEPPDRRSVAQQRHACEANTGLRGPKVDT